ncbi:hypothetical protein HYH03_002682 [Edaphochlamys debaryana]|uniref:EF-hand domain-containing protein n=1 Tax=Edaphochlamys debaryana TaxID=47281 RepID=A0A836C4E1_9CHLO|nr:hypothetical protein HYH03_002682 [Edaphochlamys debaryana]|eukprot:KAG2499750.1 hypothetical protein HYH03_002682 [Edaphochlamys debaryana]
MPSVSDYPSLDGWELSALFLIFLGITICWDALLGLLTFLNNILRGRKANWLTRVKEELLALGVVSLVLLFIEPSLQQICIPLSSAEPTYPEGAPAPPPPPPVVVPYGTYLCNVYSRQVFTRSVIHAAHYLLFYLAIVHILFSLLTSVITNVKLAKWSVLERTARKEQNIPQISFLRIASTVDRSNHQDKPALGSRMREVYRDAIGYVDQDLYSLLRFMCEKRFRAHHVVLRNFNFLNMCEQCLEAELNEVYSHAWLLVFMMALLLLYNRVVYQIVWISGLCILAMACMAGNMRWVMKKTAREARNLWRKIHGQGGIEHDDDEDVIEAFGVPEEGATASQLVELGTAAAGVGGDLGDDQLPRHGGAAGGPKPKELRFAPRPVGEAVEAGPREAASIDPCAAAGPSGGGQGLHAEPSCSGGGRGGPAAAPARRSCFLVEMVESGKAARRTVNSLRRAQLAGDGPGGAAAAVVTPPAWLERHSRPREPQAQEEAQAPSCSGQGADGAKEPRCRARGRRQGPGPVAEATVDNPLYSPRANGGQYGMAGAGGGGMPYGNGGGGGMAGMAAGGGYGYGMPMAGGMGMMSGGMATMNGGMGNGGMANGGMGLGMVQQQQQPYSGAMLVAAAAASPYGSAPALPPGGPSGGAPTLGDAGQWGSNQSSGGAAPEVLPDATQPSSSGSSSGSSSSSSGSKSRAAKKKHGPDNDDDSSVHSEKSILEHELAAGIEEKITRLFFFGRPFLLLWIFNVIFAQASLTMTMSLAFIIPYDKFDSIREVAQPIYIWLPIVLSNLFLVFYGCWVFLPQYALLSVTGVLEPHEVMIEIKRSKTQDNSEEGVVGVVLEKLTHTFVGKHDGETRLSTAFIVSLASQAGIILGKDYKAEKHINATPLKVMYKELVLVWHDIAWYGDLTSTYRIKTDVEALHEAFNELDEDGSGALSFGELANMIRSLGTYATTGDVEAMLWEIDIDGSHSIGYDEFVKFLTYAFFDTRQMGYIDVDALMDGMERLGMPINEMQAAVLMTVGHCDPDEEVKVTLRQFFEMFEKVSFDEEDEEEDGKEGSAKGSFFGRALDALRAPSRLITGLVSRQASGSVKAQASTSASGVGPGLGPGAERKDPSGHLAAQRSGLSAAGSAAGSGTDAPSRAGSGLPPGQGSAAAVANLRAPSRLAVMSKAGTGSA